MPRIKKKRQETPPVPQFRFPWMSDLSLWTAGKSFGLPTYTKSEYGIIYEIEPMQVGDLMLYRCGATRDKQGSPTKYVAADGTLSGESVYYRSPEECLPVVAKHYEDFRLAMMKSDTSRQTSFEKGRITARPRRGGSSRFGG